VEPDLTTKSHFKAKRAIILAAGAGRRLGLFTEAHPKPLLKIHGRSILENCLDQLAVNGITHTVIIVGHMRDQIVERIGDRYEGMRIDYVISENYATTNNVYSLWCAREYLDRTILLLEADLFFDGELIVAVQDCPAPDVVAVARHRHGMDGTVVRLDTAGAITALIEGARQGADFDYSDTFKTVNIYRFSQNFLAREFVPALDRTIAAGQTGGYYELLLKETLTREQTKLMAVDCSAIRWYEIDDANDRRQAEYLFLAPKEKLRFVSSQYGSYWRYSIIDHSYLYNMYFPPPDMWLRLGRDLQLIAKQYPVGQAAAADLLSELIDAPPSQLVVANGASELIRIVCSELRKKIIVPVPSFNEYENATLPENLVRYPLLQPAFKLDVDDFAAQAKSSGCSLAIVVSPNNPSGRLVPRADLMRLCEELRPVGIVLLLDESFVDFCEDPEHQSLEPLMPRHPNLVILKSMSKAYGIGGLRLGYLASKNAEFLGEVRARLPIWNINGLAEGFLRLLPRYHSEFKNSRRTVYFDTQEFYRLLTAIPGVEAEAPQGNFVLVRLQEKWKSNEIAQRFFLEHNILVKHCVGKSMPDGARYLRISTRTPDENRKFAMLLANMLK